MSESIAVTSPASDPAAADRPDHPYAPSWLHMLVAFVVRLPGPSWVVYVVAWVVATLLWPAQVWSSGRVAIGTFDPVSAYWGFLAPALLWAAASRGLRRS